MTPYSDQLNVICAADPELGEPITKLKNLEAIIRWIPTAGLSLAQFDSVQQDEYNYDVTFPVFDQRWIAFGVT